MFGFRFFSFVLFSLTCFLLVGCGTVGNSSLKEETEVDARSKIVKNVTTKNEIRSMYGSPYTTSYTDGGLEIWKYEFTRQVPTVSSFVPVVNWFSSGVKGNKKELTILFSDDGIVKKFNMSESPVTSKMGILH